MAIFHGSKISEPQRINWNHNFKRMIDLAEEYTKNMGCESTLDTLAEWVKSIRLTNWYFGECSPKIIFCGVSNKTNWSFKTLSKTIYRNVSFDKEQFCSWRGVLDTTVCDDVCQWLATCRWYSLCTSPSSTNKIDCHDITEILLTVALNIITITITLVWVCMFNTDLIR